MGDFDFNFVSVVLLALLLSSINSNGVRCCFSINMYFCSFLQIIASVVESDHGSVMTYNLFVCQLNGIRSVGIGTNIH